MNSGICSTWPPRAYPVNGLPPRYFNPAAVISPALIPGITVLLSFPLTGLPADGVPASLEPTKLVPSSVGVNCDVAGLTRPDKICSSLGSTLASCG